MLIEIQNSNIKQYYYNVVKKLRNVRRDDITTTEHFYYNVKDCYKNMLGVGKCVDLLKCLVTNFVVLTSSEIE